MKYVEYKRGDASIQTMPDQKVLRPFEVSGATQSIDKRRFTSCSTRIRALRISCFPKVLVLFAVILSNTTVLCYSSRSISLSRRRFHHKTNGWTNRRRLSTIVAMATAEDASDESSIEQDQIKKLERKFKNRISRLEEIVAKQEVEIHRLRKTCSELSETTEAFAKIISLLRESSRDQKSETKDTKTPAGNKDSKSNVEMGRKVVESYDESIIFGTAPSSVIDAADAAGAAILAGTLAGKKRMVVDVRDAELSTDSETLVQFIELAILPVAAGFEGLQTKRNRVKIVFPKVSQLLEYRRTMALAAPEVVALSTLGFDPVEDSDQLVVIVAPGPDDSEGLQAMAKLLAPTESNSNGSVQQTVVILNYHMAPVPSLPVKFETAYHLRLLRVQYMAGGNANQYFGQFQNAMEQNVEDGSGKESDESESQVGDEALEAAMQHAHEVGMNQGVTRAMVIRAYPRPWHLFVDTSPGTDADFEVAATFVEEPTMEDINFAIVECLEGSEREDEIVAMQMQQALEDGQLENVSGMIGEVLEYGDDDLEEDDDRGFDASLGDQDEI